MPMKMCPVPKQGLTGPLNSFGRMLTTDRSLYRKAFGDNTLKFASHEENYMIQVFAN
jgi:hypothetical protein